MIPIWILVLLGLLMGILLGIMWRSQRKIRLQLIQNENFTNILKQSIEQTERQVNFWQSTCDNMRDAVIWINQDNRIININQPTCELYQYDNEEFLNLDLTKLELDEADYPAVFRENFWEKLTVKSHFVIETVHRRKNGKSFWAEVFMTKIYNGNQMYACAIIRNISKRKRRQFSEQSILAQLKLAETKQKQNEQNIRAIIESTQDEILAVDNLLNLSVANSAFLNRIKQQTGILLQQGECVADYLPESVKAYRQKHPKNIDSQLFEEVIALENGHKKYIEIIINPIRDADNKVLGMAFFMRNISERKQAEKTLKINENRFKTLMQNLQGMVYRLAHDEAQTMLFVSAGVQELMHISPEQFTNRERALNQFILAEYREKVIKKIQKAFLKEKPFEVQYPILIQGKRRWFLEKARPIRITNGELILEGFITDITLQVEAEERLRTSEQLLRNYMLHTPANMFIKNLAGEYLQANPYLCEMLGLEEEEILESTDYELYDTDIADEITSTDVQILASGQGDTFEQTVRLADGTERILWTSKFPLRDKNDQVCAIGGVSFDITERKKAEEELMRLKNNLQDAVQTKTEELQTSNETLKQLLVDYQYQTEELRTQEEELLQNMEQLHQTNLILEQTKNDIHIANQRFEILHSGANEGLWDWYIPEDGKLSEGSMIWVSEQYKKLLLGKEYTQEGDYQQYNATGWEHNIHPADRDLMKEALHHHLEDWTGNTPYDVEFRVKVDGQYRWFRERCTTIRKKNGHPVRAVGSLQDITEEKLLKSEIDNLLIRYDLAFRSTREGIWDIEIRSDGIFSQENTWISPQLKKLWQVEQQSDWTLSLRETDKRAMIQDLTTFIRQSNPKNKGFEHEYLMTLPDQSQRWFRAVGAAVYDPKTKRFVRLAGIISDITDKKELERLKENLQREVDRQTQELQTQQEELFSQNEQLMMTLDQLKYAQAHLVNSEKMASLGQLTAGIAHEINNPVSYISASIEGLQMSVEDILEVIRAYEGITPENAAEKLAEIEDIKDEIEYDEVLDSLTELTANISTGAKRTAQIVKGLRHFSRLDEGALKQASIHDGLDSTLLLLRNKTKNRIEIIKNYDPNIGQIECFPGQLNQVFMNILSNAVQAIHGKGKIFVQTKTEGDNVEIYIRDTGKGIPEVIKEKIFEPFFTTKDVGEGTGLGLSISYGIIERHQGAITVENTPNQGAEFRITLPKKAPKSRQK